MAIRLGVDLGGTKIEAIALGDSGETLARERTPTPQGDYEASLGTIADLVAGIEAGLGARGTVGVAMPGAISHATGRVKNANSTWLNGRPLREDLERTLGREVRLANDANCFALSEAVDGAGRGMRMVFGVILGTGCGGGIAFDGAVWTGPNAIAGEWGHNPIPWATPDEWPGPSCYCGQTGCIETFLSGTGLSRDYEAATNRTADARLIAGLADGGDPGAQAALCRYEDRMARALAGVLNILDPDAVVFGGGVSNIARLYDSIPRLWGRYAFSDRIDTPLLAPQHGDSSGVRGAAWLFGGPEKPV
jgi:fructokinase